MKLEYRPADTSDMEPLYELNKEQIDCYEDVRKIDYDKVLAWIRKKLEDSIREHSCIFWNGNKSGYFRFYLTNGKMEIDDLYVFSPVQDHGIGTAVLKKCLTSTDLPVFLYVFSRNIRAVALYRRLGFEVIKKAGTTRYVMQIPGYRNAEREDKTDVSPKNER